MAMETFIKLLPAISAVLLIFGLLVWVVISSRKQVDKDWKTLLALEKRADEVETKEEIEIFHKEFQEKAKKIHNEFITPRLTKIDGYLRGKYSQYKNK